jgi:hypothetical protein
MSDNITFSRCPRILTPVFRYTRRLASRLEVLLAFGCLEVLSSCNARIDSVVDSSPEHLRSRVAATVPKFSPEICKPAKRIEPPKTGDSSPCGGAVRGIDPKIIEVEYVVRPTGGTAVRTVYPDGRVHGGHVSSSPAGAIGGDDHGCVSARCVRAVWQLAADAYAEVAIGKVPEGPAEENVVVRLVAESDRGKYVSWKLGEEAPTERLRQLAQLIGAMEIGYW